MSANTFMLACRALWGSEWQSEAARGLGISLSSVLRYANGERVVPQAVYEALSGVIDERLASLGVCSPRSPVATGGCVMNDLLYSIDRTLFIGLSVIAMELAVIIWRVW